MGVENLPHETGVHHRIPVHEDVAEADRAAHCVCCLRRDPTGLVEQLEQLLIRLRLAQSVVADDVRSDVLARLDGDLQRVLDEASLEQVGLDELGARETS